MPQEPVELQEEKLTATELSEPIEAPAEEKRELTPQEVEKLEKEIKKQQLLAQLEEECQDTPMGRLCRSKNFWYAVFGAVFVAIMLALISWAARDLGYWGR